MIFVLQTIKNSIQDEDVFTIKKLIDRSSYNNSYFYMDIKDISISGLLSLDKEFIPIGNLEFVQKWMEEKYKISRLSPIEVPSILRRPEFLKRNYSFVEKKDLNLSGRKFIKYIEKLKSFSYLGDLESLDDKNLPNGMYVISEIIPIIAEYRVFVSDLKIKAIQFYDGDCTIFPDVNKISEMILFYYLDKNRPASYTLDIGVTKNNDTIILEIHPIVSVGLYGYAEEDLLYMHSEGIEWYKTHEDFVTYKE